jgi:drug/metabolite transporter (DMT)-like permease
MAACVPATVDLFGNRNLRLSRMTVNSTLPVPAGSLRGPDRPNVEDPLRGVALIVAATMCFSLSDVMAKYIGQHLPPVELTWIRYLVFVAMATTRFLISGRRNVRVRNPGLQVARGVALVGSAVFFIMALGRLPLADAAAVGFVSPLLITALSMPMLGEVVGRRRWAAVAVGFIGVLVVVRPGTGAFQPGAVWVLASSFTWALASILTRRIAGTDAATTLLWSSVTGLLLLTLLLPTGFMVPAWWQTLFCVGLGLVAGTGQFLMVQAYRHAGAALLAPLSYGQMVYAVVLGWLVFHDLPDTWTLAGAAIIIASGIYTVHRERVRARRSGP